MCLWSPGSARVSGGSQVIRNDGRATEFPGEGQFWREAEIPRKLVLLPIPSHPPCSKEQVPTM